MVVDVESDAAAAVVGVVDGMSVIAAPCSAAPALPSPPITAVDACDGADADVDSADVDCAAGMALDAVTGADSVADGAAVTFSVLSLLGCAVTSSTILLSDCCCSCGGVTLAVAVLSGELG